MNYNNALFSQKLYLFLFMNISNFAATAIYIIYNMFDLSRSFTTIIF